MARIPTPFDTLLGLQKGLDAYRRSGWLEPGVSGRGAYPPINVFRSGDDFTLIAEVPGVKKADIEVQVKGRTVRLSGTKQADYPKGASLHRRERQAGRFDRTLSLPVDIEADKVKAECRDGVLKLTLPRAERDKPRTIQVS